MMPAEKIKYNTVMVAKKAITKAPTKKQFFRVLKKVAKKS